MNSKDENRPLRSWRTLGWALALLALNALICRELFFTEYTQFMGSIEAAYIGISRYAIDHPFQWDWFPLWYGGIPYHNTYPPLLHLVVAAVAWLLGISPALSHHAVTAALYALGPVTLYLLLLALSRRQYPSLLAALLYSLVSPAPFFIEQLRSWAHSPLHPARLQALLEFGDGPHVAAVTLLPLAVLALHFALEQRRPLPTFLAAAALAAVVLTNWLGAFALAIAAVSYLLARANEPGWLGLLCWAGVTGAIGYGLALPWIPPSNIADIRHNAQYTTDPSPITLRHAFYAALIIGSVIVVWRLFRRYRPTLIVGFTFYLLFFFATLVLVDDRLGIRLMPQAWRYHHEFELAFCAFAVFMLARPVRDVAGRWIRGLGVATAMLLVLVQYGNYRARAKDVIQPIEITQTIEFQIADWLRVNRPEDRVFISGAAQFWLPAFTDTPQFGGGFGQGIVNRTVPTVHFGIPFTKGDGEVVAMWLRVYGVQTLVVSSAEGRDFYREVWIDPEKFRDVLPALWRDGGDVIYAVPQRSRSLAHVILPEHVPFRTPGNNLDIAPVEPLAAALEDPSLPLASFEWTTSSDAAISSDLAPDHLLFVQVTHHPGWRAWVDGTPRRIRKDPLGFMVVEPRCEGPCEVTLSFDGGAEMLLARLLCALTILAGVIWATLARRKLAAP